MSGRLRSPVGSQVAVGLHAPCVRLCSRFPLDPRLKHIDDLGFPTSPTGRKTLPCVPFCGGFLGSTYPLSNV